MMTFEPLEPTFLYSYRTDCVLYTKNSQNVDLRTATNKQIRYNIMSAYPQPGQVYETAGNPTDKSNREQSKAQVNAQTDDDNAV